MTETETKGRLFVVATPIGCLEDITHRAVRVLNEVDAILAEDTRHSRKLCAHYNITTRLQSFHAHSSQAKLDRCIDRLQSGENLALITDAGTPLVSDPGSKLVVEAVAAGIAVEPIPGPSAVLTALSAAGLCPQPFRFEGFLPRSGAKRRAVLERIASEVGTSVVFESAERLPKTLSDLESALGVERRVAVCRELTKKHEEILRGRLHELRSALPDKLRGEITLVIEGAADQESERSPDPAEVEALIDDCATKGMGTKEIAAELAERTGLSRKDAYQAVLKHHDR